MSKDLITQANAKRQRPMASSSNSSVKVESSARTLLSTNMVSSGNRVPCNLAQETHALAVQQYIDSNNNNTALLGQLLASLQTIRSAKPVGPETRSSQLGGDSAQGHLGVALVEQLSQLDLSKNSSPTSPLSREESIASLASSLSIPVTPSHTLTGSIPFNATNISAPPLAPATARAAGSLPRTLEAAAAPTHSLGFPIQSTNHSTPVFTSVQPQQLLQGLTHSVYPGLPLPAQQVQPLLPASNSLLLGASAPAPQLTQYLQHQQLLQLQQAQQEECLVGLNGQYQSYCHQIITDDINYLANSLLCKLKVLQQADPHQGMWAKRFFCSIKEVSKVVHRAKCLIVAPDVKPNAAAHINPVRMLMQVIRTAQDCGVPVVFALSRRGIGQVFGREKSMSIVAVMSDNQCEQECQKLLELAQLGCHTFLLHRGLSQALPATCQAALFRQSFF